MAPWLLELKGMNARSYELCAHMSSSVVQSFSRSFGSIILDTLLFLSIIFSLMGYSRSERMILQLFGSALIGLHSNDWTGDSQLRFKKELKVSIQYQSEQHSS